MLVFLQIQHGVVYYFLAPLLILLTSYLQDSTLKSSGRTSGQTFRIPGRNHQNFWSAIYCGCQNGVGTYLTMADHPWRNHHICFRQPGPGLLNLQVSAISGGPTLRQTSTSAEVSEPLAHLEVEIKPCQAADSQLGRCPRRVQHHWSSRALAPLPPAGGSYSFAFSPPVAVQDAWLLCLGWDDLDWTPSRSQAGAG